MNIQLSKIQNKWAVSADKNGGVIVIEVDNKPALFKCVPQSLSEYKNKNALKQYFNTASKKLRGKI